MQAVIAARGGELGVARDLLARSGLQQEAHPAAQMLGAILDLDRGNLASATLAFDRLYARQPDNSRIRDLFAYALARSGAEREPPRVPPTNCPARWRSNTTPSVAM